MNYNRLNMLETPNQGSNENEVVEINTEAESKKPYERMDDSLALSIINQKVDLDDIAERYKNMSKYIEKDKLANDMVRDIARLTLEMKDRIDDYDIIISDDSSGRLPSLFFRRLINSRRNRQKRDNIETYFISNGRNRKNEVYEGIRDFLAKKIKGDKKVLLVTEFIASGKSIYEIVKILQGLGVNFDLASVSVSYDLFQLSKDSYASEIRKHLIYGDDGGSSGYYGGIYFFKHYGSGVKKDEHSTNVHPRKFQYYQMEINKARKSINFLANELSPLLD